MNNSDIGKTLKKLRKSISFTQKDMADELRETYYLSCKQDDISRYENGKQAISFDILIAYSDFFDVSADFILGLSEFETTDKDERYICDYLGLNESTIFSLSDDGINPRSLRKIVNFISEGNEKTDWFIECFEMFEKQNQELSSFILRIIESEEVKELLNLDRITDPEKEKYIKKILVTNDSFKEATDLVEYRLQKQFLIILEVYLSQFGIISTKDKEDYSIIIKKLTNLLHQKEGDQNGKDQEEK